MISLNQSFPFKLWWFEIRDESASELPYLQIIQEYLCSFVSICGSSSLAVGHFSSHDLHGAA